MFAINYTVADDSGCTERTIGMSTKARRRRYFSVINIRCAVSVKPTIRQKKKLSGTVVCFKGKSTSFVRLCGDIMKVISRRVGMKGDASPVLTPSAS